MNTPGVLLRLDLSEGLPAVIAARTDRASPPQRLIIERTVGDEHLLWPEDALAARCPVRIRLGPDAACEEGERCLHAALARSASSDGALRSLLLAAAVTVDIGLPSGLLRRREGRLVSADVLLSGDPQRPDVPSEVVLVRGVTGRSRASYSIEPTHTTCPNCGRARCAGHARAREIAARHQGLFTWLPRVARDPEMGLTELAGRERPAARYPLAGVDLLVIAITERAIPAYALALESGDERMVIEPERALPQPPCSACTGRCLHRDLYDRLAVQARWSALRPLRGERSG